MVILVDWYKSLREGREVVEDLQRSSRPCTSTNDEKNKSKNKFDPIFVFAYICGRNKVGRCLTVDQPIQTPEKNEHVFINATLKTNRGA